MNKKILIVVIALAVIIGGGLAGTSVVSSKTEETFTQIHENANEQYAPNKFELVSYERGFLTSKAVTKITLDNAYLAAFMDSDFKEEVAVTVEHEIYHGPFILGKADGGVLGLVSSSSKINLESLPFEPIQKIFGGKEQPVLKSKVGFGGDMEVMLQSPEYGDIEIAREGTATIMPLEMKMKVSSDKKSVKGDLEWKGFKLSVPNDSGTEEGMAGMEKLVVEFDQQQTEEEIWVGGSKSVVSLIYFKVQSSDSPINFEMTDLGVESNVAAAEEVLNTGTKFSFKNLSFKDKKFGPGELAINLNSIDKSAYVELTKWAEDMDWAAMTKMSSSDDYYVRQQAQQQSEEYFGELKLQLLKLLGKQPYLEIENLSLTTLDGDLKGTGKVSLGEIDPALLANPMGVFAALMAVKAESNLRAPIGLLKDSPQYYRQVNAMVDAGFLKKEGEDLVIDAKFAGGQLTVNGNPIPLFQ